MRQALDTIATMLANADALTCPWGKVQYQHATAIRSQLAEKYASSTANKMLSALRCRAQGGLAAGPDGCGGLPQGGQLVAHPGREPPGRPGVTRGELQALMDACAADFRAVGVRDAAIIGLLYSCGLRVGELCSLDLADLDRELVN